MKIDKFVIAIIAVIFFAWLFPEPGSKNSRIPLDTIGSIGISVIFFFYGLKLNAEKIKSGLKNWKLHCLVQAATFILFPLVVIIFYPFFQNTASHVHWLSFLFLAALPSTVSSSVVMVSLARGNVPAAIFNATLSGLIGIIVTPLWMGIFIQHADNDFDFGDIYFQLLIEILVPVISGILLQRYWGKYAIQYSRQLTLFDKSVILLIIYKSFAISFDEQVFTSVKLSYLLLITAAVLALLFFMYLITGNAAVLLKLNTEDRITASFCGTKKSLVHGTVFSKILFPASIPAGIILLPLMLYHAIQLLIISAIAAKYARRNNDTGETKDL